MWLALSLMACNPEGADSDPGDGSTDRPDDTDPPTTTPPTEDTGGTTSPCSPEGTADCPIPVSVFPTTDRRDTTTAESTVDSYACAPGTDESGPELFYAVDVPEEGILTAYVAADPGVDIDLHLLSSVDPASCLVRDHTTLGWRVAAGTHIVVADTWVDGGGTPQSGAYDLRIDFFGSSGPCAMDLEEQRMFWDDCAPGIDCVEQGTDVLLRLPAAGPVVKEAHLVTVDDGFGTGWPTSFTDGIPAHYATSQAATGYVSARSEPWAPAGEGGSEYGQGSTGAKVPTLDEAWYVNMYWRDRPTGGTRMLVIDPRSSQAVVTSAGYETGPGANDSVGGAVEEIHIALGTEHRDVLVMGFAADQALSLGPMDCTP